MNPRGEDRRRAPRRHDDARLHYAREALIGAALIVADVAAAPPSEFESGFAAALDAVEHAAANYRAAVERTIPSWS